MKMDSRRLSRKRRTSYVEVGILKFSTGEFPYVIAALIYIAWIRASFPEMAPK